MPQQNIGSFHGTQHKNNMLLDLFLILVWVVVVVTRRVSSNPFFEG